MADSPADKPADAPAQPDPTVSGADDHPAAAPPEVEAEVVDDGYRKPPPATEPPRAAGSAGDAAATAEKPSAAKPAPTFALPVRPWLFIAGAATLAAIALAAWMMTRGPKDAPQAVSPAALPPAAAGEARQPAPASPQGAPSTEEPAAPSAAPASSLTPTAGGKIDNAGAGAAKNDAAALDPEAVDTGAAPASARGLPPPPASFGDDSARQSAKEALRALSPRAGEDDPGDAVDLGPAAEDHYTEDAESPSAGQTAPAREATAPPVAPPVAPPASPAGAPSGADIGKLANEVDALKSQLAEAQARNEQQAAEIAELRDGFQQALIDRDRREGAAVASLGASLAERLDKIQAGSAAPRGREAAASLALVALSRAVDSGGPYAAELNALARIAPHLDQGAPALDALRPRAETGAPTLTALKAAFPAAARAARAADRAARAGGPLATFFARLENLVSVRPAEPIAGDGAAAIVSRAEDRLDREMLAAAVAELDTLSGPAAAAFADWLADAGARLSAERAVAELNRSLLAELTQ